jgi:hypothetical protein
VVCLKLLDWLATGAPANVPLALGRYLLLFFVGWLLFVWMSHHIAGVLNKQALWPRFIAIWAYCSIVENTLVAIGGLPGALGAPAIVDQCAELVTVGWALWLEWYAIRLSQHRCHHDVDRRAGRIARRAVPSRRKEEVRDAWRFRRNKHPGRSHSHAHPRFIPTCVDVGRRAFVPLGPDPRIGYLRRGI